MAQLQNGLTDALHVLTRHLVLQRTKARHLPDLPPISHEIVYTNLHEKTQLDYDIILSQTKTAADRINQEKDQNIPPDKGNFLQMITALRLYCDHPQMAEETIKSIDGVSSPNTIVSESTSDGKFLVKIVHPEHVWLSPKLEKLVELLENEQQQDILPSKSVIFSMWTIYLDWCVLHHDV